MKNLFKTGHAVIVKTQEELNELALLSNQFEIDSIVVESEMFAFQDEIGAVIVLPMDEYIEEEFVYLHKKFSKWKRGLK